MWVALWDLLSLKELCFAAVEPVLEIVSEGWVHQSWYPWFSSNSLFCSVLRLVAGGRYSVFRKLGYEEVTKDVSGFEVVRFFVDTELQAVVRSYW